MQRKWPMHNLGSRKGNEVCHCSSITPISHVHIPGFRTSGFQVGASVILTCYTKALANFTKISTLNKPTPAPTSGTLVEIMLFLLPKAFKYKLKVCDFLRYTHTHTHKYYSGEFNHIVPFHKAISSLEGLTAQNCASTAHTLDSLLTMNYPRPLGP